ncbi:hypothetical protein, partial [Vibrio cidicii]|uniref:hypothetical protein n=1 Tax=Vibrio cidicii TaxID=1763883 RepID=UPI003703DEE9
MTESQPTRRENRAATKRPWYATVPGLRIFATPPAAAPSTVVATVDSDDVPMLSRPVDVPPATLPGGTLRTASGAAARGWYAPSLTGAPSTTRQAEVLNTAIIGNPTGVEGIVNGRDNLSQTMVSHDAPTAYNMK